MLYFLGIFLVIFQSHHVAGLVQNSPSKYHKHNFFFKKKYTVTMLLIAIIFIILYEN